MSLPPSESLWHYVVILLVASNLLLWIGLLLTIRKVHYVRHFRMIQPPKPLQGTEMTFEFAPAVDLANASLRRGRPILKRAGSCENIWTPKLKAPIELDDGRRLVTAADARSLMIGLPEDHLHSSHWQAAGTLLMRAVTKKSVSMDELQSQLLIAIRAEGLLNRPD